MWMDFRSSDIDPPHQLQTMTRRQRTAVYTFRRIRFAASQLSEDCVLRIMSMLSLKDLSICACLNKQYFRELMDSHFQMLSPVLETMAAKSPIFYPNRTGRQPRTRLGMTFNLGLNAWQQAPNLSWLPPHAKVPLRSCAGVICYTTPRVAAYIMCSPFNRKFMVLPRDGTFHGIVHEMIEVPPLAAGKNNNNNPAEWREQSSASFQLIVMGLSNWHKRKPEREAGRSPERLYHNVLRIYDSRTKAWSAPVDVPATEDFPVMVFARRVNLVVAYTEVPAVLSTYCKGVLYMISFVSGVCVAYVLQTGNMITLLRKPQQWKDLKLGRPLPHLVASEDRVFLVDNIDNCEVSIYELPGPEQVVRSGLLQQEVIEEPTLVSTMYTNVQVFSPNKQANSEHTLNCFYQSGRIFLMSDSGTEAVMYHLVDGTWTWLPKFPLLGVHGRRVDRIVGLPFTPRLGIRF